MGSKEAGSVIWLHSSRSNTLKEDNTWVTLTMKENTFYAFTQLKYSATSPHQHLFATDSSLIPTPLCYRSFLDPLLVCSHNMHFNFTDTQVYLFGVRIEEDPL